MRRRGPISKCTAYFSYLMIRSLVHMNEKLLILYSNVSLIAHSAKVLGSRRGTEHILLLQYRYTPLRICTFIWKIHFWKDMQRRVKDSVDVEDSTYKPSADFHEEVVGLLWR